MGEFEAGHGDRAHHLLVKWLQADKTGASQRAKRLWIGAIRYGATALLGWAAIAGLFGPHPVTFLTCATGALISFPPLADAARRKLGIRVPTAAPIVIAFVVAIGGGLLVAQPWRSAPPTKSIPTQKQVAAVENAKRLLAKPGARGAVAGEALEIMRQGYGGGVAYDAAGEDVFREAFAMKEADPIGAAIYEFTTSVDTVYLPRVRAISTGSPIPPGEIVTWLERVDDLAQVVVDAESLPLAADQKAQLRKLKAELAAKQVALFPKLRSAFVADARDRLWVNDVKVTSQSSKSILLTGTRFAANRNVQETHLQLRPSLIKLRFSQDSYRGSEFSGAATYDLPHQPDALVRPSKFALVD